MAAVDNIVRIAEYRRRRHAQRAAAAPVAGSQYFCLRCEAEEFRLYGSGTIHCAKCGSLIRNIHVDSSRQPQGE
jgi:ribosomal protein L37AE/L43A